VLSIGPLARAFSPQLLHRIQPWALPQARIERDFIALAQ